MPAAYRVGVDIFPLDLGLSANLATLAEACGDADIPVNNADGIPNGTIAEIDEKTWRETWDLDVFGYINLTRHYDTRIRPSATKRRRPG